MQFKYIDTHCHLQFEQYAKDEAELIERMHAEGVASIVVGVDRESSEKAVALAEKHERVFASVGLHPNHADELFDEETFCKLAEHPKVVAIGECGLDYYRLKVNEEMPVVSEVEPKNKQKELLQKHIELAVALDKPLIVHTRPSKGTMDAYHDMIEILKEAKAEYPNLRGDIHFFVGGVEEAEACIALGFTVSFTAVITFARDYDAVIRAVPLTSILSETDAPYVAPVSRRGKRNDPLTVINVVEKIASIRGEDPELVRTALLANAEKMFALPV